MKNNVGIVLFRYRNLIFGRNFYLNPNLVGNIIFHRRDSCTTVYSIRACVLNYDRLYLRGTDKYYDNDVLFTIYDNCNIAKKYYLNFIKDIECINNLTTEELRNHSLTRNYRR